EYPLLLRGEHPIFDASTDDAVHQRVAVDLGFVDAFIQRTISRITSVIAHPIVGDAVLGRLDYECLYLWHNRVDDLALPVRQDDISERFRVVCPLDTTAVPLDEKE